MHARPNGFTLTEVLVALALISVLGGMLASSMLPHIAGSHAHRLAGDLTALNNAVALFLGDTERFPSSISQLNTPITTSDQDLYGRSYLPAQVDGWRGPYTNRLTSGSTLLTGGDAAIRMALDTGSWQGRPYLRVAVAGVDQEGARRVSQIMDGDTLVGSDGTGDLNGRIRWKAGQPDTLVFLMRPVWR